jgi:tetratricopeptide (TPR) repeat protein
MARWWVRPEDAAAIAVHGRDRALAELDAGDARAAAVTAEGALAVLMSAGLGDGPDVAALLLAIAEIAESQGNFPDARNAAERAVVLIGDAGGDEDAETWLLWCRAQQRLAAQERIAGDHARAEHRLLQVLDRRGADSVEVLVATCDALGTVYRYSGRFDDADAAYRRALAATADPLTVASLLHNLAELAHSRGRPETGIADAERGLELRIAGRGADHPDTARDLDTVGRLYQAVGRRADAGRAYRRALTIFDAAYGPGSVEVAMVYGGLAALASGAGDHDEGERLGRRALAVLEAALGPDDVEVGVTLLELATAVAGQGRSDEARALLARSDSVLSATLPGDHPHRIAVGEARHALSAPH